MPKLSKSKGEPNAKTIKMETNGKTMFDTSMPILTLSQTTNSRLFQTEGVCRRQFQIWWKGQKVP